MDQKIFIPYVHGKVCGILKEFSKDYAVIICHGLTSSKDSKTGTALREKLADNQITTLSIDLYAHGESSGEMADLTVSRAVDSVVAAYNYLKENGHKKIALVGSSFSGVVCLVAATKLELQALVLKCPVFDYPLLLGNRNKEIEKWKETGIREMFSVKFKYGLYEDAVGLHIQKTARNVTCPTLFIHGLGDKLVPPSHSEQAFETIGSSDKKVHFIKGADHFFIHEKHFNEVIKESCNWLISHR